MIALHSGDLATVFYNDCEAQTPALAMKQPLPRWAPRMRVAQACVIGALLTVSVLMLWRASPPNRNGSFEFLRYRGLLRRTGLRSGGSSTIPQSCQVYLNDNVDRPLAVILTADPGEFVGTSEAHHIIANLKHITVKARNATVCADHYHGYLMGSQVLVITTGIGPTAAALCVLEVLTACGPVITDVLYFGTSGWSPQLGGILNAPDCASVNNNGKATRLGDVCVSPFSVNWICKKTTWSDQAGGFPNQCSCPADIAGPNASLLYGQCEFFSQGVQQEADIRLARELVQAARAAAGQSQLPRRSGLVVGHERDYWQRMSEGTGSAFPRPDQEHVPTLWDHTQCMEADSQLFYSGAPWELKARQYVASTLNKAMQYTGNETRTGRDVIAVSAMEGVGVGEALVKYRRLAAAQGHVLAFTNVRAASNWIHQPLQQTSPGVWEVYRELPEDYINGYGYAIATGSTVVLELFQARCLTAGHSAQRCAFRVDYATGLQQAMGLLVAAAA